MSVNVAVAEGLNNFAMFGVKGGVTPPGGQFERPVSFASSKGNGSCTFAPSAGKEKDVCSVGESSCAVTASDRSSISITGALYNIAQVD